MSLQQVTGLVKYVRHEPNDLREAVMASIAADSPIPAEFSAAVVQSRPPVLYEIFRDTKYREELRHPLALASQVAETTRAIESKVPVRFNLTKQFHDRRREGKSTVGLLALASDLRRQWRRLLSDLSEPAGLRLEYLFQLQLLPPAIRKEMANYLAVTFSVAREHNRLPRQPIDVSKVNVQFLQLKIAEDGSASRADPVLTDALLSVNDQGQISWVQRGYWEAGFLPSDRKHQGIPLRYATTLANVIAMHEAIETSALLHIDPRPRVAVTRRLNLHDLLRDEKRFELMQSVPEELEIEHSSLSTSLAILEVMHGRYNADMIVHVLRLVSPGETYGVAPWNHIDFPDLLVEITADDIDGISELFHEETVASSATVLAVARAFELLDGCKFDRHLAAAIASKLPQNENKIAPARWLDETRLSESMLTHLRAAVDSAIEPEDGEDANSALFRAIYAKLPPHDGWVLLRAVVESEILRFDDQLYFPADFLIGKQVSQFLKGRKQKVLFRPRHFGRDTWTRDAMPHFDDEVAAIQIMR